MSLRAEIVAAPFKRRLPYHAVKGKTSEDSKPALRETAGFSPGVAVAVVGAAWERAPAVAVRAVSALRALLSSPLTWRGSLTPPLKGGVYNDFSPYQQHHPQSRLQA